jgi:uncharacterized protein (DUF433 family)
MAIEWQGYIHSDPEILMGKAVVKGTRLAVDFILGLFAAGWSEQQVLESYPSLTPEALQAVFAFAAECVRDEALYSTASDAVAGYRDGGASLRAGQPVSSHSALPSLFLAAEELPRNR